MKTSSRKLSFVNDTTNTEDDFVSYPLAIGQTLNITQAAGGTPNADTHLVVSGTALGDLVGWMSMSTQSGANGFDFTDVDYCRSYEGASGKVDAIADN